MQGFLVALCMAILEKIIMKGTVAFDKYLELRRELEANAKLAQDYQKAIKEGASREKRKNEEDRILS